MVAQTYIDTHCQFSIPTSNKKCKCVRVHYNVGKALLRNSTWMLNPVGPCSNPTNAPARLNLRPNIVDAPKN
jgi:hypothetical protein